MDPNSNVNYRRKIGPETDKMAVLRPCLAIFLPTALHLSQTRRSFEMLEGLFENFRWKKKKYQTDFFCLLGQKTFGGKMWVVPFVKPVHKIGA